MAISCDLTLRTIKGSKLTFNELDSNFLNLRNCIYQLNTTDTYVTGGTYSSGTTSLDFVGNVGFTPFSVDVSNLNGGGTIIAGNYLPLSGNTSGTCLNELWVSSISGCSPVNFGTEVVFNQNASMGSSAGDTGVALKFFHQDPGDESTIQTDADNLIIGGKAIKLLSDDAVSLTISDVLQVTGGPTGMVFEGGVGQSFNFNAPTLTGSRSAIFPDKSGTVAYTSDLSSVTGFTYSNNNFTISQSGGLSDLVSNISVMTGLTVNGQTTMSSNTQNVLTVIGSGATEPIFTVQGSSGELFSITDSLVGSLFAVNDISGLPILEVFDNDTVLMGNFQAPSLNTTVYSTPPASQSIIYTLPTSAYTGGFFEYTATLDGVGGRSGSINSYWSGTSEVIFTDVTSGSIGDTSGVLFNFDFSGNNVNFNVSANTSGWEIKTIVRSI